MDAQEQQKALLHKFQKRILQMGEPDSLYQPFQKVSHKKSSRKDFAEKQRDAYRETHRETQKNVVKTVVPRQVELSNYKIYQVILDSNDRNKTSYPNPSQFVLKVATPLRNVFGIRLLKSELLYHSLTPGNGIYLSLNGYKLLLRNEVQDSLSLFARITPGINDYSCVTTNILDDPYTYILNPMEPKLQRFEVSIYDHDNQLKVDTHFNLLLHMAVFCYV